MLVGIAGRAGSGKSTVAQHLEDTIPNARRMPLAGPLKRFVGDVYGLSHEQLYGDLKNKIDPRYAKSPRQLLQEVGTDVMRAYDEKVWVRAMLRNDDDDHIYLVDDVRFPNEAEAIRSAGGFVLYVWRLPMEMEAPGHISEALTPTWCDHIVHNQGTIEELQSKTEEIIRNGIN